MRLTLPPRTPSFLRTSHLGLVAWTPAHCPGGSVSSSGRSRLFGRVVVDHHDVMYLLRHHHVAPSDQHDVLVVFVLDAAHRLTHTFISDNFPRGSIEAVELINEHLATLAELGDADAVVICWCTGPMTHPDLAHDQLELLAGLHLGVLFADLDLIDLYWVFPSGFLSLRDRAAAR